NAGDNPSLLEHIQGPWGVCQLSVDGVQVPVGEPPNGFMMRVDGAELRYSFLIDQRPTDIRFFLTTSPDQPHEIDARILSGQWTGRVVKGLAELKGDTLRICLADRPELERPKKIDPKAPGQYFV